MVANSGIPGPLFLTKIYNKRVNLNLAAILTICFLSIFYGVNTYFNSLISILWVGIFIFNIFKKEKYLILGVLTIFQTQFEIFGFSAFKIVIILFALFEIIDFKKTRLSMTIPSIIFCGIMISFGIFIFFMQGLGLTFLIPYCCSCITIVLLINNFYNNFDLFKYFSFGFIIGFLICSLSGVFLILIGKGNLSTIVVRFKGTMPDPNHYSMHGMLALLFSFFLIKNKKIKIIACITILLFCILSASTNFFFCLSISLIGVFISTNINKSGGKEKILFRISFALIIVLSLLLFLYLSNVLGYITYKYPNSNSGVMKLVRQFYALQTGDFETFSSYRTDIWKSYLDYFVHQNVFRMIFGGNLSSTYGVQNFIDSVISNRASHNTFIDILMCTGIVGFFVFVLSCVFSFYKATHKSNLHNTSALFILMKLAVLIYFFGLSCFPSWFLFLILFI